MYFNVGERGVKSEQLLAHRRL